MMVVAMECHNAMIYTRNRRKHAAVDVKMESLNALVILIKNQLRRVAAVAKRENLLVLVRHKRSLHVVMGAEMARIAKAHQFIIS